MSAPAVAVAGCCTATVRCWPAGKAADEPRTLYADQTGLLPAVFTGPDFLKRTLSVMSMQLLCVLIRLSMARRWPPARNIRRLLSGAVREIKERQ